MWKEKLGNHSVLPLCISAPNCSVPTEFLGTQCNKMNPSTHSKPALKLAEAPLRVLSENLQKWYYEQNKQVESQNRQRGVFFSSSHYSRSNPVSGLRMHLSCSPSAVTWAGIIPVDISSWSNIICKEKAL